MYKWYIVHMGCTVHIGCVAHVESHVFKIYLWHIGYTAYMGCQGCKSVFHCLFTLSDGEPNHTSTSMTYPGSDA